jgi:hypothetical protein
VFETSLDSALSDSLYDVGCALDEHGVYVGEVSTYIFFALKRYFELIFGYLVEQILNSGSLFSLTILTLFARIVVLELYNFSNNLLKIWFHTVSIHLLGLLV